MGHPTTYNPDELADELEKARSSSKVMVQGTLNLFKAEGDLTMNHLVVLAFVERAQAFHEGVVDMVESGNPLAAATLLRSFAENLAVAFYIDKHPHESEKLHPGAERGLPMGRVVAAAENRLPGFKALYDHLSSMAHPSGAGAFQTIQISGDGRFRWQSKPTFQSSDHARRILRWLEELRAMSTSVILQTAEAAGTAQENHPPAK